MHIVIIDGQGGGMGRALVERVRSVLPQATITAVGTNSSATAAMLKAGAHQGATGENAARYNCQKADIVMGPIGIILANSMLGEITPGIAAAVSGCDAQKILIPVSKCHAHIAGLEELSFPQYLDQAISILQKICNEPTSRSC
ncbi:MAG TPA: DUF3842 family protein [Candidatus Gallacutalibacter stercoravium]|nr:DUF3842 family protein [Candidatus Gallacutalibacter stercoravium]